MLIVSRPGEVGRHKLYVIAAQHALNELASNIMFDASMEISSLLSICFKLATFQGRLNM
jgi:hypothetical protein